MSKFFGDVDGPEASDGKAGAGAGGAPRAASIPESMQLDTSSLLRYAFVHDQTEVVDRALALIKSERPLPDFLTHQNRLVSDEFVALCERQRLTVFYQNTMDMARLLDREYPLKDSPKKSAAYAKTDMSGNAKRENAVLVEYQKAYQDLQDGQLDDPGVADAEVTVVRRLLAEINQPDIELNANDKIDREIKSNFIANVKALQKELAPKDVMMILEGDPDAVEPELEAGAFFPSTLHAGSRVDSQHATINDKYHVEYPGATGPLHNAWCKQTGEDLSAIVSILIDYQSHGKSSNKFVRAAQVLRLKVVGDILQVLKAVIIPALECEEVDPYQVRETVYHMVRRLKRVVFETVNMPSVIARQLADGDADIPVVSAKDMAEIEPGRLYDRNITVLRVLFKERVSYLASLEELCRLPENMLYSCLDFLRSYYYSDQGTIASLIQSSFIKQTTESLLKLQIESAKISPVKISGPHDAAFISNSYSFDRVVEVMARLLKMQMACLNKPQKLAQIGSSEGNDYHPYEAYQEDEPQPIAVNLTPEKFHQHGSSLVKLLIHPAYGVARLLPVCISDEVSKRLAIEMSAKVLPPISASQVAMRASASQDRVSARPLGDIHIASLVAEDRGARSPQPLSVRPRADGSPPIHPPHSTFQSSRRVVVLDDLEDGSDSDSSSGSERDDVQEPTPAGPLATAAPVGDYPPLPTSPDALESAEADAKADAGAPCGLVGSSFAIRHRVEPDSVPDGSTDPHEPVPA